MAAVTKVGEHEIEAACIVEGGAFYATVIVRATHPGGAIRSVGYVFDQAHATDAEATKAAERMALLTAMNAERHIVSADRKFS